MNDYPTIFVIFGVTGDLARRKLLPALFRLFEHNLMPQRFHIAGFSRREWNSADLAKYIDDILETKAKNRETLKKFLEHFSYARGLFDDKKSYTNLKEHLDRVDATWGICSNKLLYLAVSPEFYKTIFVELKSTGLTIPCGGELGWTRILVEKPFGHDLKTAELLEAKLQRSFKEEQIFRIDHYLAKEALQNILVFRFSNPILKPLWSRSMIDSVYIRLYENSGMAERGMLYDGVGALRDVGQNHVLQMLALVAMDEPKGMTAKHIRQKRSQILKNLKPISQKDISVRTVRAQYEGFKNEKGVAKKSETETYFKIRAEISGAKWRGVPFILESGKELGESRVEIEIRFKTEDQKPPNRLCIKISPHEGIAMTFITKKPGFVHEVIEDTLSYSYKLPEGVEATPDAYERVLFDCIRGDQTLFASSSEVRASWQFITPILKGWQKSKLITYKKGTKPNTSI